MFRSAVGRLIWKEYRVQRGLWLLLLGLLLALQIVLRLAFFSTASQQSSFVSSNDELWATWAMWFVAFAGQVVFLFASAAIAFAGEREERTCDWLVQLAPSPWAVLLAKTGTCLVGSIALYLCGALVALLLGRSNANDPYANYQIFFVSHAIGSDLVARMTIVIGLLVWCIFGSLLSQRVLTSIPTMGVGWVVAGWIPMALVVGLLSIVPLEIAPLSTDQFILLSGFVLVVVGMIAVDAWLGYRWVQGRYCDFQFLVGYRDFWSTAWYGLVDRSERPSRIPRGIELEEFERRPWQRLVWQERRRNVMARWLVILVCALALASPYVPDHNHLHYGVPSAQDCVVGVLALVMGVLAFRSEGEGQPVRFMANHGVSPGMIWRAKQFVWMTRAFLTPAALLILVAIGDSNMISNHAGQIERHVWLILLSYGCGQLAAMLLRRAMLAAIAGATAAGILFLWFELMRSLHMPQWWSLGIPAISPLLATRLHSKPWLLDGATRPQKVRLSAVLIGLPLLTCAIVATYRALEVSWTEPAWQSGLVFHDPYRWQHFPGQGNLRATGLAADQTIRGRLRAIADMPVERGPQAKSGSANVALSVKERKLAGEVAGYFSTHSTLIHVGLDQTPDGQPMVGDPIGLQMRGRARVLRVAPEHLFPITSFDKLCDLVLSAAEDHLLANEPQPAFDLCLAQLNMCQAMACGPFDPCWQAGASRERRGLELLVDWANHRQVSHAEIHGAIKDLEERFRQFPSPGSAIIDELDEAKRASIVEEFAKRHGGATVGWLQVWLNLPWEVSRRHQLWDREALLHRANLSYLANRISHGPDLTGRASYGPRNGVDENLVPVGSDYLKPLAELNATTWGAEIALTRDRSEFVRDRFTATKATLTRMGIIAYRKQHGKMPADLDALFGIVRQSNFQDPWSGGRFDYRTNCLTSQGTGQSVIETDLQNEAASHARTDQLPQPNWPPGIPTAQQARDTQPPLKASRFIFPIPQVMADQKLLPD